MIEEAKILAWESRRKVDGVGESKGDAMASQVFIFRDDGEDEGSGEGERKTRGRVFERERSWEEDMALVLL